MMISTKGRYALRVMVDLAEHDNGAYTPLKEVAARQEISEKYLEIILKVLVQNHLLTGLRGKGGGYRLTKKPEEYSIGEILRLTEEDLAPVSCLELGEEKCPRAAECRTLPLWLKLDEMMTDFLDGISLADLMRQEGTKAETSLETAVQ